MKARLERVSTLTWAILALPALVVGHQIFVAVCPEVVRLLVPEALRNLLRLL
ncbi:MAG: hypothetical protein JST79_02040 [Acidobacteria bacterium]|jgi:hypothetical protein|nr:hypothetical protein [Acidobacteriota bacterium]